jgi:hypothetical protein
VAAEIGLIVEDPCWKVNLGKCRTRVPAINHLDGWVRSKLLKYAIAAEQYPGKPISSTFVD